MTGAPKLTGERARRAVALVQYEWIKVRSLRSTWLLIAVLLGVMALAGIDSLHAAAHGRASHTIDPLYDTTGLAMAQYAAAALGVLTVTGEYATRSVRSTALAAPRRLHAYTAKAIVISATVFGASMLYTCVVLAAIRPILGSHSAQVSGLALIRAAIGADLYLALITLLAVGVAAATRYTAGALLLLAGLLLLAPEVVAHQYLPVAGLNLAHSTQVAASSLWAGLGVLILWTSASIAIGAVSINRREL